MSALKQNYCRFCAEQKVDDDLFNPTLYPGINEDLKEKLKFFNINYIDLSTDDDCLPKTVCISCNNSLNLAHNFIRNLRRSQTKLKQLFVKDLVVKTSSDANIYQGINVNIQSDEITEHKSELINSYSSQSRPDNLLSEDELFDTIFNENDTDTSGSEYVSEQPIIEDDNFLPMYCGVPIFEPEIKIVPVPEDSWSSSTWRCQFCEQTCTDINLFREHSKKAHDMCSTFKCADCEVASCNFEKFVAHMREHNETLRNYCQYCNAKIEPGHLTEHIATHLEKENICDRCGKIFTDKYYLKEHKGKYRVLKRKLSTDGKRRKRSRGHNYYVLPVWEIAKIENKSWNGYPWTCRVCDTYFGDIDSIRAHIKKNHEKCFAMKCVDCDYVPESFKELAYHVMKHRTYLKEFCHYCNHKFEDVKQKTDHIAEHFVEPRKVCEGCGEMLPDQASYRHHVTTYNPPKPPKLLGVRRERPLCADDLTCNICNKLTKNLNSLRKHKESHTDKDKNNICDQCGIGFHTKSCLRQHSLRHDEKAKVHVCDTCQKRFNTSTKLKYHILTHTGEKAFSCEICERRFRLKGQMVSHKKIHTDEMPYKCHFCDKRFKHRNNVKTHEHQHTGARPYGCPDCGMDFTNWANCNKHMKRKHGTTLAKNKDVSQEQGLLQTKKGKTKKGNDYEIVKEGTEQVLTEYKRKKKPKQK